MQTAMTLVEGVTEFYLDCEAHNWRQGRRIMDSIFYNDLEKRAYSIYEQYQEEFSINNKELKMKVINSNCYGGRTWSTGESDNIEIYSGTINMCYEYFSAVMRIKTGEIVSILLENQKDINEKFFSYEALFFDDDGNCRLIDSKIRDSRIVGLLIIFCARFVLVHEMGHLFNGHCEYVKKESSLLSYLPMVLKKKEVINEKITALDYRTMEMDADSFAATDTYKSLIVLYNLFEEKVDSELNIRPIELFYWWSFAIRSQSLITQDLEKNHYYKEMLNLPSVIRWANISGVFLKCLESRMLKIEYRKGDNEEVLLQQFLNGCQDAERIFNEIKHTEHNWIEEIKNGSLYDEFGRDIHNNWRKLRKKLEHYSRLPLY